MSRYQKGKTNLDFTEARDREWQWHQLGYMQVCTSLQTDNHASTPPLSFLQAGCPSYRPSNSVNAMKATSSPRKGPLNGYMPVHVLTNLCKQHCHFKIKSNGNKRTIFHDSSPIMTGFFTGASLLLI